MHVAIFGFRSFFSLVNFSSTFFLFVARSHVLDARLFLLVAGSSLPSSPSCSFLYCGLFVSFPTTSNTQFARLCVCLIIVFGSIHCCSSCCCCILPSATSFFIFVVDYSGVFSFFDGLLRLFFVVFRVLLTSSCCQVHALPVCLAVSCFFSWAPSFFVNSYE